MGHQLKNNHCPLCDKRGFDLMGACVDPVPVPLVIPTQIAPKSNLELRIEALEAEVIGIKTIQLQGKNNVT
jgi:hypothetical protein